MQNVIVRVCHFYIECFFNYLFLLILVVVGFLVWMLITDKEFTPHFFENLWMLIQWSLKFWFVLITMILTYFGTASFINRRTFLSRYARIGYREINQ